MRIAVVMDPIASVNYKKDSTLAMLWAAAKRGHELFYLEAGDLSLREGRAYGRLAALQVFEDPAKWFALGEPELRPLAEMDAILMRKDPPFDSEYFYATHLLEQAEREGAKVFNKPAALRDHPEKLSILEFPQFIAPTLVTRDAADIRRFHAEQRDIILKPLDGMGGMGIFRVGPDGLNLGSITETLNRHGAQSLMVQKFLPEIVDGDKRVLVIGGKPVPYCLARIPQGGEVRGRYSLLGLDPDLVFRATGPACEVNRIWRHDRAAFAPLAGDSLSELRALVKTCHIDVPAALLPYMGGISRLTPA